MTGAKREGEQSRRADDLLVTAPGGAEALWVAQQIVESCEVLVADDDEELGALVGEALREGGFSVRVVTDGAQALAEVARGHYAVVVLDLLLPGVDGIEVCRQVRLHNKGLLIIMVTALGELGDRVVGLQAGADDYLVKPFALVELLARVHALLRRSGHGHTEPLIVDDLRLDVATGRAWRGRTELALSPRERSLLEMFLRRAGIALTRQMILSTVWGPDARVAPNVVDQYVRHLRRKIDAPFGTASLQTVHGLGYRLHVRDPT